MNLVKQSWLLVLALLTVSWNASAHSEVQATLITGPGIKIVEAPSVQSVERQRILLPQILIDRLATHFVKVGAARGGSYAGLTKHSRSLRLSEIQLQGNRIVLVGHRLVSHGVSNKGFVPVWLEQVRLTLPRQYLANSWDVLSLQRELERLGIVVKPKPAAPKPSPQSNQLSG